MALVETGAAANWDNGLVGGSAAAQAGILAAANTGVDVSVGRAGGQIGANVVVFGQRMPRAATLDHVADCTLRDSGCLPLDAGQVRDATGGRLPIVLMAGAGRIEDRDVRQVVVATEAADWSPAAARSVYALVGSYLAARHEIDEPVIAAAIATFSLPPH